MIVYFSIHLPWRLMSDHLDKEKKVKLLSIGKRGKCNILSKIYYLKHLLSKSCIFLRAWKEPSGRASKVCIFRFCSFCCNFLDTFNNNYNSRCFKLKMLLFLLFSGDSPVHHLDSIIDHWIYKTPGLIDNAVEVSNKDNRFTVTKRVSQVHIYFH